MRLFALLLAATTLPVAATNIYKWTDAQGQVHYSQTPPPAGTPSVQSQSQQKVQPGARMAAPVVPKAAETFPPAAAAANAERAENRSKRCAAAKERQAFLASTIPRRVMVVGPDGQPARMTEEQFAESVKKAEEAGKGC